MAEQFELAAGADDRVDAARAKGIAEAPEKRALCDLLAGWLIANKMEYDAGLRSADAYAIARAHDLKWLRRFQDEIFEATGKRYNPVGLTKHGDKPD